MVYPFSFFWLAEKIPHETLGWSKVVQEKSHVGETLIMCPRCDYTSLSSYRRDTWWSARPHIEPLLWWAHPSQRDSFVLGRPYPELTPYHRDTSISLRSFVKPLHSPRAHSISARPSVVGRNFCRNHNSFGDTMASRWDIFQSPKSLGKLISLRWDFILSKRPYGTYILLLEGTTCWWDIS